MVYTSNQDKEEFLSLLRIKTQRYKFRWFWRFDYRKFLNLYEKGKVIHLKEKRNNKFVLYYKPEENSFNPFLTFCGQIKSINSGIQIDGKFRISNKILIYLLKLVSILGLLTLGIIISGKGNIKLFIFWGILLFIFIVGLGICYIINWLIWGKYKVIRTIYREFIVGKLNCVEVDIDAAGKI